MEELIFHFNDRPALQVQCADKCQQLYDHFWKMILEDCDEKNFLPQEKLDRINKTYSSIHWLPRYACAILIKLLGPVYSTISMVGLDHWESPVHASDQGRESIAVADVRTTFALGSVLTESLERIMSNFKSTIQ